MPVKVITTELGHSVPPEAPHNITFHIPGWETAKALRRGDPTLLSKLSSIYPRFGPWCEVRQLAQAIHAKLSLPANYGLVLFVSPDTFLAAQSFSSSTRWRKPEHLVSPSELLFRVVEVPISPSEKIRLYISCFPATKAPAVVGIWQNYGIGICSRLAEACLAHLDSLQVLDFQATGADDVSLSNLPEPTYLPLGEAHAGLNERIVELAQRAALVPEKASLLRAERDVFLYPTGMAAVYRLHKALWEARGKEGKVVVLGSVFHNTYHLFEESEGGMQHFGRCDGTSNVMEELGAWLEAEKKGGRKPAYAFAEFPSNPILVSLDLKRLRELADKYDFPVVIDDTIGSFANIDVLPFADVIVTSITKSLSGYANVMGGSLLLPPSSPYHHSIISTLNTQFHNEYFHPAAAKLLSNSADYLPRSQILNRNAFSLAKYLQTEHVSSASSPVKAVLYPPFTDTKSKYDVTMRPSTPEFPEPGYGCLLAIDFESLPLAKAFYNNLSVYHGPHLGAHQTLAFPFNDAIWGVEPEAAEYLKTFGASPEQVRISVGLESEEELLDTFKFALEKAIEEKKRLEAADTTA
ncbi:putative cystathionine gamma-synthase [Podospora australis]|uniref:Cystathionine gamma-synthase n=1 Tax=Podospora australis TaxID=1536484 RepID=A0AAN6X2F9_9PEZI|nr:putative cystathionine gamma-synthase [Podospora australis]